VVKKSAFNQFQLGDIMQICMNPLSDEPTWFQFWNYPLRDQEDIQIAKEIVETQGSCLGWGVATFANKGTGDGFRTVTP